MNDLSNIAKKGTIKPAPYLQTLDSLVFRDYDAELDIVEISTSEVKREVDYSNNIPQIVAKRKYFVMWQNDIKEVYK